MVTTVEPCDSAIAQYLATLESGFDAQPTADGCIITTPYRLPDNDAIQLGVMMEDGEVVITDFGETCAWLSLVGLSNPAQRYGSDIRRICERHGVQFDRGEFYQVVRDQSVGAVFQAVLSAVSDASHLVLKRQTRIARIPFEDVVESFLLSSRHSYERGYRIRGAAQEHEFDFYVNNETNALIETISATTAQHVGNQAVRVGYKVLDLKQVPGQLFRFVSLLNDDLEEASLVFTSDALAPLSAYTQVIYWREREKLFDPAFLTGPQH